MWQEGHSKKYYDKDQWFLRKDLLDKRLERVRLKMVKQGFIAGMTVSALVAGVVAAVPAFGAPDNRTLLRGSPRSDFGYFTPTAADPKLAAMFARGGLVNRGFRFTPVALDKNRAVTVAVRAASSRRIAPSIDRTESRALVAAVPSTNIGVQPESYSLGAAVGWKRFALTSDVAKIDTGVVSGKRERADLGISYNARQWSSKVQVAAERPVGIAPRNPINGGETYSLDVGGSYRLTRNLDVTAGVRYRSDRDRLQNVSDARRDSQAVYVGTAFRF